MANKKPMSDPAVDRLRQRLAWGFGGLLIAVLLAGVLYALGVFDTGTAEYDAIPGTTPPKPGTQLRVVEYFSYACPHCRDFEPQIEEFVADLPPGVRFERIPVVFGASDQEAQARAYYALQAAGALEENHARLFAGIHDQGRRLGDDAAIAAYVDGHGIDAARFTRLTTAGPVRARIGDALAAQQRDSVTSIPMLVVGDHYRIEIARVGRAGALRIARELIDAHLAKGGTTQ